MGDVVWERWHVDSNGRPCVCGTLLRQNVTIGGDPWVQPAPPTAIAEIEVRAVDDKAHYTGDYGCEPDHYEVLILFDNDGQIGTITWEFSTARGAVQFAEACSGAVSSFATEAMWWSLECTDDE